MRRAPIQTLLGTGRNSYMLERGAISLQTVHVAVVLQNSFLRVYVFSRSATTRIPKIKVPFTCALSPVFQSHGHQARTVNLMNKETIHR